MKFKDVKVGDVYAYDTGVAKGRYVISRKSDFGLCMIFDDGCSQFEQSIDWKCYFSRDKLISRNSTVTVSVS